MVCIIASGFTIAQSNVLISDDDWTLTSTNGACNCATNSITDLLLIFLTQEIIQIPIRQMKMKLLHYALTLVDLKWWQYLEPMPDIL